jgi:hypothetical protein
MSQNETEVNKGAQGKAAQAGGARLVTSDAPASAGGDEQEYYVDGQSVSREAYMEALPKAGYVPERMPANHYPAISTK